MKYSVFKIKEGKETQWKKWVAYLLAHEKEVLESLKEEKVTRETLAQYGDILVWEMEGECLPASDSKLNRMHNKNREECLERVSPNVLFDFK